MPDFTLPHDERLRSFGAVRRLFQEGHGGFVYPFRYVVYAEYDDRFSVEVLFSVPKKNHKRANVRNLLRRRTKEAYRLNKSILHDNAKSANVDMALIYSSKEVVDYKTIENAIRKILATVVEDL
ncbi:MAG: ribonuclease P [Rikenellaceae bacterium]|nr:ribonuclease P [Rikenellaceae bacterium]